MITFDAVQYKTTTRRQWEDAAPAWNRWGPTLEAWLGEATERMLDAARITTGARVLDVAAGAGGQTIAAARRVGPTGRVLATDISPAILEYASRAAARVGLANVEARELDGEAVDSLGPDAFDAVISRIGLIYFPDQERALSGMHRVLRRGGRLAAVVYATADENAFFSLPVSIIRRRAELPPPAPGRPGPFSLGGPGVLADTLASAGFSDVAVDAVDAPLRLPTAADCVRFERESFGALHQMLAGVPEAERGSVWEEIHTALSRFEGDGGFAGPCRLLVVGATK
ncbi:MAG: class I SAM-dependent methyltransferase [Candidatus Dormibacteria bacterium]